MQPGSDTMKKNWTCPIRLIIRVLQPNCSQTVNQRTILDLNQGTQNEYKNMNDILWYISKWESRSYIESRCIMSRFLERETKKTAREFWQNETTKREVYLLTKIHWNLFNSFFLYIGNISLRLWHFPSSNSKQLPRESKGLKLKEQTYQISPWS